MLEPYVHPYSTVAPYRFEAPGVHLEEEPLAPELLHLGECAAARFRWSGDAEIAQREAVHATILRALSYDHFDTNEVQTPQQYKAITYARFLDGSSRERGLQYALYKGPYARSRTTNLRSRLGETEAWLAGLLGVVMLQTPLNPYPIRNNEVVHVDKLAFREWTTDGYAGWFNAGREWWGTFLWTIAWPERGVLVGITASSTD